MKIIKHLRSDWFRYGFETIAVIVGILIAFALENWNNERRTRTAAEAFTQKIISDIVADTNNINNHIDYCLQMLDNIDLYFDFFDHENIELDDLIDSASNVKRNLFRYLPINYTFIDMQSSGNTVLLSDEQRISLIELSNNQEYLQIIIEKVIVDIKKEEHERDKYLDFDRSPLNFYERTFVQQDQRSKVQGLKHQHNLLTRNHELASQMITKGESIKEKSRLCLDLLKDQ